MNLCTRKNFVAGAMLAVTLLGLAVLLGASANAQVSSNSHGDSAIPSATFPGTNTGAIPDGVTCGTYNATTRVVNFEVTGITGAPTDVAVSMTVSHTWVGDLRAVLRAPNGTAHTIFESTGSATGAGDDSNLVGPYVFNDAATGNWWTAAAGVPGTSPIPAGSYRTSSDTGALTVMTSAFSGIPTSNGTWTLTFADRCPADVGTVSAANLTVDGGTGVAANGPLDYNGDGKTDYAVVRNMGGGANGQLRWFYNPSGTTTTIAKDWGLASDFIISGNWDTDANDDIAIWRPGAAGVAAFYILRSTDSTAIVERFGQTGDDPSVVANYTGDGRTDFAVYREGVLAGQQSTWFYRSAATLGGQVFYIPWGQTGDSPAPGDYDGNGSADFAVQRPASGLGQFWIRLSTGATLPVQTFGLSNDLVVPGDYDGDGKTDLAVTRNGGGVITWYFRPIAGGADQQVVWGASATDFVAQGDYDGDGKTDQAVWRPSTTAGASAFYVRGSAGTTLIVPFGQNLDYPVANYNSR